MIQIGDQAPDFLARSTDNKGIWLRSLKGRPVVLYFFPKAFTPGCTEETKLFRDRYSEIQSRGAELVGISVDSFDAQCQFAAKHGVSFPMISDDSKQIARSYEVFRPMLRVARRVTYVIDEAGIIEAIFDHELNPAAHVNDVLELLRRRTRLDHQTIPPRTSRAPGEVIADRYQLKTRLAEGGIGEVWSAEHLHLRREVAIKLLKESLRTSPEQAVDMLERFRLESQVAALLGRKTEHVVSVHDAGFSEVGPYLAMELVQGKTLFDELQERGPMSPDQVLPLLEQIVDALSAAHTAGIVHRDLKPSNVLLKSEPGRPVLVKLTDFGLAKSTTDELLLDRPKDTLETVVMGTVEYMSPEQLRGGVRADPRMDIWALGVVVYEMLTGTLPFDGPSKTNVMARIIANNARPITEVRPELPKALDGWLARALAKDPSGRFASVQDMLDAFRGALASVTLRSLVVPMEIRRAQENAATELMPAAMTPVRERRRPPMMAVGVALALAAVCAWVGIQGARKAEESSRTSAPLPISAGAPAISTGPMSDVDPTRALIDEAKAASDERPSASASASAVPSALASSAAAPSSPTPSPSPATAKPPSSQSSPSSSAKVPREKRDPSSVF